MTHGQLSLPAILSAALIGCSSSSAKLETASPDSGAVDAATVDAFSETVVGVDGSVPDSGTDDTGVATVPKPPLAGLVDMQDISWQNTAGATPEFTMDDVGQFPGTFGGIVINATWDVMEPTQGSALDVSRIDAALTEVRAYNVAHPEAPLGTKLRIYGGANAPAWAKQMQGGPVTIQRNPQGCQSGNCPLTIGPTWTGTYIAAWRAFLSKVAARYDTEPLVRHVTVTSCAQQTDEPFVPTVDATSKATLAAAGFTDDLQKACLSGAVDDYDAWKLTNVDYTFNAFVPTTGPADAKNFPETVMAACRTKLGTRCVLGNHALSAPLRAADQGIYDFIANPTLKGPVSFQSDSPQKMGCLWVQTIAQGVALGAGSIEVWPKATLGGFDGFMAAQVAQLAAEFAMPVALDPNPMPLPNPCTGFH
jgi:hypothetical protein